jgi:two-component system, LytTR family, sensor kinase
MRTIPSILDSPNLGLGTGPRPSDRNTQTAGDLPAPVVERLIAGQYWRWWPLAGMWAALAFLIAFGVFVSYAGSGRDVSLGWAMYATFPHFLVYALVSPALYSALHELIAGTRRSAGIALLLGWGAVAIGGSTVMCYLGLAVRGGFLPTQTGLIEKLVGPPLGPPYQAMNLSILLLTFAALGVVLGFRLRDRARWEAAQASLRGARLEAQLAEAKLHALQSQINPHFLLNSLNAIGSLVQVGDRDRAYDAIERVGDLLRTALRSGADVHATLGDEFDFLERYLKLCELRFESRFQYNISIPEELRSRRMPALVVQPLIENALRHGMQPPRRLNLEIRAYETNASVVIEVEDDGRSISPECASSLPAGHGLANVAERLKIFFGGAGALQLEVRKPQGTIARIVCPA